ncbi:MAG: acetyltransferase [Burkholderiales bacterium PBB2]|nr:MAG: acetyltransferase [Burkholderiales bacterium PBB2]
MNVDAYLERLAYRGSRQPNLATLAALQWAHLRQIPFENLSIHSGEAIVLEEAALFRKIVEQRRGGFCYELNGLFAALLRELGYRVSLLSAQVAGADSTFGPEFDHLCLAVHMEDGAYLVDVGFGDCFLQPLPLEPEAAPSRQGRHVYRIQALGGVRTLQQLPAEHVASASWSDEYRFSLQARDLSDFEPMCRFHQSSPDSHFTRKRICSRATDDGGRISLSDLRLILTTAEGFKTESLLPSEAACQQALLDHFGIQA